MRPAGGKAIAHAVPDVLVNVFMLLGVSAVLFWLNPTLMLLTLLPIPLILLAMRGFALYVHPAFVKRQIELGELFTLMNVPRVGQVHLFYRARMTDTALDPGPETLEARLFHEHEVPWDEIAFRTVRETLQHFFACRRAGQGYPLHTGDIG